MAKDLLKSAIATRFRLSKEAILALPGLKQHTFEEGETVVALRSAARSCYVVLDGYVAETAGRDDGTCGILRLVAAGGTIGFGNLFTGKTTAYRYAYTAVTPVTVVELPRRALEGLLTRGKSADLQEDVIRLLADVADEQALRGNFLEGNNRTENLVKLLKHNRWGNPAPVKWKYIARYLGMNICAFSRSLARLRG